MKQCYKRRPATQRPATSFQVGIGRYRIGTLLLLLLGMTLGANAQEQASKFFQTDNQARAAAAASPLAGALFHSQALTLDVAGLRAVLATAPTETQAGAVPLVLVLPLPDGRTGRFALHEAPVMAPALAARFPSIKTYAGVGIDDASASVRLDLTPLGFHAQVLTGRGNSFYIDPVSRTDTRHYLSFYRKDMNRAAAGAAPSCDFAPTVADLKADASRLAARMGTTPLARSSGPQLRTYRLALANTPEYALTKGNTLAGVMAGEVATVNRVVGVYEKELAVRLVLVANNDQLVFLSGTGTQPSPAYSNTNGNDMLGQNQTNVDRIIGSANYDIGHVVSTGGGGVAYLGVVCNPARKAGGVTGSSNPVGDAFDIDYVAHEMGHQFAGNHPFNGNADNCAGSNRNASTAWEPGSGSTIMAYAGICGSANDLQPNSDPTFHTGNFEQMRAFIEGTTCAVNTATGNTAPTVTAPAGGKTLPISTPFKLTAAATDAENDVLTYSWEEMDLGNTGTPTTAQAANDNVPLFRSFNPTLSGTRYFPRLSNLVANTTLIGERLPTVTRTLKFRCTARDEHSGPAGIIGGVDFSSFVNLSVTSTAGPFVVTAPNTAVSWTGGTGQMVTWNIAGTNNAPVSCALVNLRLSTDGGLTYPTILAINEPNDGSALVAVPNVATTTARVMVEAADNYFFDISNVNFSITTVPGPTISSFTPSGGLTGTVVIIAGTNFTGSTSVSFNGTAAASFVVNSATQITATVAAGTTTGPITIVAPTGTGTSVTPFVVGNPPVIASFTPNTGAIGTTVVITGTNFTGTTLVQFNGAYASIFTVNSASQITVTVPAGATTGPISLTTPTGTATSATSFTVIPPPVIASFSPAAGVAGTVVTLTGDFFTGATAVSFNGINAPTFTVVSTTQITVTVPAGVTTGLISVTTPGGTNISASPFVTNDLCVNALPIACGQSMVGSTIGTTATGDPTSACGAETPSGGGGVFYTIVGTGANITATTCSPNTNFDTTLFIYSGSCGAYTCVDSNDDTGGSCSIASTVTFPTLAGTTYYIFVTGYLATDRGAFTLRATCATPPPVPVITSLAPNTGPIASSTQIVGSNFTGATRVTFNGIPTTYTVLDAQNIMAMVPNGATSGNVVVFNGGVFSNGVPFTVTTPVPTITRVAPPSASVGTTVTLTGTGFGGATSVTFNGIAATTFNVTSATSMTVVVPAAATTGNIVVTTGGGVSNGILFTVIAPVPAVSSLSPANGPAGTVVTITGTDFAGTTGLTLNGLAISGFTVVNTTTITFAVPAGASTGDVIVTTASGASASGQIFTLSTVSATANASQRDFSVWPNPIEAKGILHVTLAVPAVSASLTLRTVLGQLVTTRTFSGTTTEFSTTGLAAGTYLLMVQTDRHAPSIQRVVVK